MRINRDANPIRYFDMDGKEIHEGDTVFMDGRSREVYLTDEGELGTDATNPDWVAIGRAYPTEFGIYPFVEADNPVLVTVGRN